MRTLKIEEQSAPKVFQSAASSWRKTYQCQLITPMVGGGIKSWQADRINPARSQSIKGQLRFWWRTMQSFPTAVTLKEAEDALWGSTQVAPKLRVQVELCSEPQPETLRRTRGRAQQYIDYGNYPEYVLFPLQGQKDEQGNPVREFTLIAGLSFKLVLAGQTLTTGEIEAVENSVALWVLFGGMGARTRRGCGSLYCEEIMSRFHSGHDIKNFLRSISGSTPRLGSSPYPVLANCRFGFASSNQETIPLWSAYLGNDYRNIRQGAIGRDPVPLGGNTPGRSRWPEPDVIRRMTGKIAGHAPRHPDQWFPRAAFGLPIQTKFNTNRTPLDPAGEYTLLPAGYERWPSPLILKVIRLNGETSAKIWLLLNHATPGNLTLNGTAAPITSGLLPTAKAGKVALAGSPLPSGRPAAPGPGTDPYDVLFTYLNVPEVI